jgi:putative glutamine amidotransferase
MPATPVIGISCSTLVLPEMRGVSRFALSNGYVRCVARAGGLPFLLPNVRPEAAPAYLARLDGVVLSGGLDVDPCHYGEEPRPGLGTVDQVRDAFELELCRAAREQGIPTLAICRGIQIMNVAFGGTLLQDIPAQVERPVRHAQQALRRDALSHSVDVVPGTRLHAVAGAERVRVNSFHHQAVDRPAPGLTVSARAPDGCVEGLEDPGHPFLLGVQWHPERRPADPLTRGLFERFVESARQAARAGA